MEPFTIEESKALSEMSNFNQSQSDKDAASYTRRMLLLPEEHISVVNIGEIAEGHKILDIGCGPGELVFRCGKVVGVDGLVLGVDISEGMIAEARRGAKEEGLGSVVFLRLNCTSTNFTSQIRQSMGEMVRFDRIILHRVLGHLPQDRGIQAKLFHMWSGLLAPQGAFVFDMSDPDTHYPNACMAKFIGGPDDGKIVERFTVIGPLDVKEVTAYGKGMIEEINQILKEKGVKGKLRSLAVVYSRNKDAQIAAGEEAQPKVENALYLKQRAKWEEMAKKELGVGDHSIATVNKKIWELLGQYTTGWRLKHGSCLHIDFQPTSVIARCQWSVVK